MQNAVLAPVAISHVAMRPCWQPFRLGETATLLATSRHRHRRLLIPPVPAGHCALIPAMWLAPLSDHPSQNRPEVLCRQSTTVCATSRAGVMPSRSYWVRMCCPACKLCRHAACALCCSGPWDRPRGMAGLQFGWGTSRCRSKSAAGGLVLSAKGGTEGD